MRYPHEWQQLTKTLPIARGIYQSYVAPPAIKSIRGHSARSQRRRIPVHLLPCNRPQGTLESAPRTSLREDSSHERWEGFWCVSDEGYYARCVRTDGSDQWYRFADDVALSQVAGARVLPLRRRRMIMFGRGRRSILVGTSRRSRGGAGVSR